MGSSFTHAHFGAGKLGLGFVVPLTRKAGLKTITLTKKSEKTEKNLVYSKLLKDKKYLLTIKKTIQDKKTKQDKIIKEEHFEPLKNFHVYHNKLEKNIIAKSLSDADLRLITTSVGEPNLGRVADAISDIIKSRNKKKIKNHLIVIACENLVSNSKELKRKVESFLNDDEKNYLRSFVYFCDCVVDRICPKIDSEKKLVNVVAYEYYKWIINKKDLPGKDIDFLQKISKKIKCVQIVNDEDFRFHEKMKIWCFNGLHLAISVYGASVWKFSHDALLSDVIGPQKNEQSIRRLQNMYTYVISSRFGISRKKLGAYQDELFERMKKDEDTTMERIINDLLRVVRDDEKRFNEVEAFLKKIEDRLIAPIEEFVSIKEYEISEKKAEERREYLSDCIGLLGSVIHVMRKEIHDEAVQKLIQQAGL